MTDRLSAACRPKADKITNVCTSVACIQSSCHWHGTELWVSEWDFMTERPFHSAALGRQTAVITWSGSAAAGETCLARLLKPQIQTLDTGQAACLREEMDQTTIVCRRERRVHIKKWGHSAGEISEQTHTSTLTIRWKEHLIINTSSFCHALTHRGCFCCSEVALSLLRSSPLNFIFRQ